MYVIEHKIKIGDYELAKFNSLKITSSRKTLGDSATIKIGGERYKKKLQEILKVGTPISIEIGYKGYGLRKEFSGYISEVMPNIPFEIVCLDEIFSLRRQEVKNENGNLGMSWKSTTLKDVIKFVAGNDIKLSNIPDVTLAPFVIEPKANKAQVLKKLKEEYGFDVYFRNGVLFCGLGYSEIIEEEPIFHLQKNVYKTDLTYRKKEDVKIKLKAISILKNNTKVEVEVGDSDGETRTWYAESPITDKESLKKIAEQQIEKYKYEGFSGKINSFGIPYATHSMICKIVDKWYPNREGKYFIDQVETTISTSTGFKREITIGKKAG